MMTSTFKAGDIVCHARTFLQSVAWYAGVPINGLVHAVDKQQGRPDKLDVEWSDGTRCPILACNVILYSEQSREPR